MLIIKNSTLVYLVCKPVLLLLVLLNCCRCSPKESAQTVPDKIHCKVFEFPLNADSTASFGYDATDDVAILAPNAISIDGDFCFVTDRLFNRIKRVSLKTGKIISSAKLPDSVARVNDCAILGNHLMATTNNGHVVFFDYDLRYLRAYHVSKAFGHVIGATEEAGTVYFPSDNFKTVTIAPSGDIFEVVNQRQTLLNTVHGRYLIKTADSIETEFVKLSNKSIKYSKLPYGGINLDYSGDYIVHYNLSDSTFYLNVCHVQSATGG